MTRLLNNPAGTGLFCEGWQRGVRIETAFSPEQPSEFSPKVILDHGHVGLFIRECQPLELSIRSGHPSCLWKKCLTSTLSFYDLGALAVPGMGQRGR